MVPQWPLLGQRKLTLNAAWRSFIGQGAWGRGLRNKRDQRQVNVEFMQHTELIKRHKDCHLAWAFSQQSQLFIFTDFSGQTGSLMLTRPWLDLPCSRRTCDPAPLPPRWRMFDNHKTTFKGPEFPVAEWDWKAWRGHYNTQLLASRVFNGCIFNSCRSHSNAFAPREQSWTSTGFNTDVHPFFHFEQSGFLSSSNAFFLSFQRGGADSSWWLCSCTFPFPEYFR